MTLFESHRDIGGMNGLREWKLETIEPGNPDPNLFSKAKLRVMDLTTQRAWYGPGVSECLKS
jgi:hypothetical protein